MESWCEYESVFWIILKFPWPRTLAKWLDSRSFVMTLVLTDNQAHLKREKAHEHVPLQNRRWLMQTKS